MPFIIRNIERLASGAIIHGVALDDPTVLHFGSAELDISPDKERPIYVRPSEGKEGFTEINFFPLQQSDATSAQLFDDCQNELELILRIKQQA